MQETEYERPIIPTHVGLANVNRRFENCTHGEEAQLHIYSKRIWNVIEFCLPRES